MKQLIIGEKTPEFSLENQFGIRINIKHKIGDKNLVIYFYPKNETPGRTAEACSFRDTYEEFMDNNCEVIGISANNVESHKQFAEKHRLSFTLLSDTNNEVRKQFGVKGNFLGLIPGRVTFVVDKTGIVRNVFNAQLQATKHISNALVTLKNLHST